jgi:mRNA-degrading endonuclease toxin of MazEF toxin-antitoxin module
MKSGTRYKAGDVVLLQVQFPDSYQVKVRPALILYTHLGNIIIAGITSNTQMKGIILSKKDGMIKESIIKTNYIFTTVPNIIKKKLTTLTKVKRQEVMQAMHKHLAQLH